MISISDSSQARSRDRRIAELERQLADAGVDPRSPAVDTLRELLADLQRKLRLAEEEVICLHTETDAAEAKFVEADQLADRRWLALRDLLSVVEPLVQERERRSLDLPPHETVADLLALRDLRKALVQAEGAM